ncbi:ubiquitin-specific protease ubp15 [Saccharomyces pastorianus]|nr:ubiquitin-specific protease ubp15 [Saccharomyces pastorianus]
MDDENATDRPMDDEQDLGMAIEHSEDMKGRIVVVQQYFKDLENRHGISFLFNLIPDETFPKTKDRLHAKFGLGQKEFSKIKLSIGYSTEEGTVFRSLQGFSDEELDKVILYDIMSNLDYIYMDHPDRLRSHSSYDRPMIIKN